MAIGSSVQPNIILLHFILTNEFTAGRTAFSASFILPILTSLIDLLTLFFCIDLLGLINLNFLSKQKLQEQKRIEDIKRETIARRKRRNEMREEKRLGGI